MTEGRSDAVMVVDDDRDVRTSIAEVLQEEGYRVSLAEDGFDALCQLREGARPGVILLDLMMPVMDGWEFLSRQRDVPALARIPVVVLTAAGNPRLGSDARPVVTCLRKPVDIGALLDAVARACERHPLS